jgi:hypothetical protein
MVVKAPGLKAWSCNRSTESKDGARNHVCSIIFDETRSETSRKTRADKFGWVVVLLRGSNNFVTHVANIWNTSEDLQSAELNTAASGPTNDGYRHGRIT